MPKHELIYRSLVPESAELDIDDTAFAAASFYQEARQCVRITQA